MKDVKYEWQALDISGHVYSEEFHILGFKNVTQDAILSTGNNSDIASETWNLRFKCSIV